MASSEVKIFETLPMNEGVHDIIIGFVGPGFIARKVIMYIADYENFSLAAHVKSQLLPPLIPIIDGQHTQNFRIYYKKEINMFLVTSDALISDKNARPIGRALLNWFLSKGVKHFYSIQEVYVDFLPKERVIYGFSTDDMDLAQFGVERIKEAAITGINACILEECMKNGFSWTSLFVPTNLVTIVDYGGSVAIIDVINKIFKLDVNVNSLKRLNKMVLKMMERRARRNNNSSMK
jgi:predicted ATP-grasp superfamily ATP-dependent carboligase